MNIKGLFFTTIMIGASSALAPAGAEDARITTLNGYYEYRGEIVITAISSATATNCANAGYSVGNIYTSRFTAPNLGNNGGNWRLSLFSFSYSQNYQFFSGNYPTSTAKDVDFSMQIGRGAGSFTVTPQVAVTKLIPSSYSVNNTYIYMEGKIRNFSSTAVNSLADGCDISFRMAGNLRP
jgi:hypothetical protein